MHFRALPTTHLRMIHKLSTVTQQHEAEDGNGSKVLEGVNGRVNVAVHLFSTFAGAQAIMTAIFWQKV